MTKVLYVGNFEPAWSTENHVAAALENLGAQVTLLQESDLAWETVPEVVRLSETDLFLWTRTAGFDPLDLEAQAQALIEISVPTVGFHLDRWWGLSRETEIRESPFFRLDWLFTAHETPAWAAAGINHVWSPPAILKSEAKLGTPRDFYSVPVIFVGNLSKYGHPEWGSYRYEIFTALTKRYGQSFREFPGPGRSQIRGSDLADLYASATVVVGDSCLAGGATHYWSDRIPETLGRGGRLVHPFVEGMEDWFSAYAFGVYPLGSVEGLIEVIDGNLDDPWNDDQDPRQEILSSHTYEQRLEQVLTRVL